MKTIYQIFADEKDTDRYNCFAATLDKAEKYLSDNGFSKFTEGIEEDGTGYQTWVKYFDEPENYPLFFAKRSPMFLHVLSYSKFIE